MLYAGLARREDRVLQGLNGYSDSPIPQALWFKIRAEAAALIRRPTIVVVPEHTDGRVGIARQRAGKWSFPQGKIHGGDRGPVEAGLRELIEKTDISADDVESVIAYLHYCQFNYLPGSFRTGFLLGTNYLAMSVRLKPNASVGLSEEVQEWHWDWPNEVRQILIEQPGVDEVDDALKGKVDQVLLPILESFVRYRTTLY